MPTILRLQGLDAKAGVQDIRKFFGCLHIPAGGVYVLGGSLREAFIAFTTQRDAHLAMRFSGTVLKGSKVTLHVSGMAELENKLESLLKRNQTSPARLPANKPEPSSDANLYFDRRIQSPPTADVSPAATGPLDLNPELPLSLHPDISNPGPLPSLDTSTAFILGVCSVLKSLQSTHERENEKSQINLPEDGGAFASVVKTQEQSVESPAGYVRLFGLPASTTKEEICRFFRGLAVQEVIVNVKLGLGYVCLVKFANAQDAKEALLFNQQVLGNVAVEVRGATEKMWISSLQECENASATGVGVKRKRSPFRETNNKRKSPSGPWSRSAPVNKLEIKSDRQARHGVDYTPLTKEYIVKVCNLPVTITKTEIKELLGCTTIPHKHVLHLLNTDGNRTDTAFIIFKESSDYDYAMNLSGCHVGSAIIEVSSITRAMMRKMMEMNRPRNHSKGLNIETNQKTDQLEISPNATQDRAAQTCLFVRNMPADVQEGQIRSLFRKYDVQKDDIFMLYDDDGRINGEAVVQFRSSQLAALAQRLHGNDFLGCKVLLTLINERQMEDVLGQQISDAVD